MLTWEEVHRLGTRKQDFSTAAAPAAQATPASVVGDCAVHFKMLSGIHGLCPLGAS